MTDLPTLSYSMTIVCILWSIEEMCFLLSASLAFSTDAGDNIVYMEQQRFDIA